MAVSMHLQAAKRDEDPSGIPGLRGHGSARDQGTGLAKSCLPMRIPEAVSGYLDPDGGAPAPEELLGFGRQDGLIAGPPQAAQAALALCGVALGGGCLQGQVQGLVAVQTVRGVVEATAVLGPRGHPLGAAVLVGILRGLGAALGRY